jgi:hypothetical protein
MLATGLLLRCHTFKESAGKCAVQPQSGAYRQASFSDPNGERQASIGFALIGNRKRRGDRVETIGGIDFP